jgi:hypothetical protein
MLIKPEQYERCISVIDFLENEVIEECEALLLEDPASEMFSLSHVCEVLSYGTIRDLTGVLHKFDPEVTATGRMWLPSVDDAQVRAFRSGPVVVNVSLGLPMADCRSICHALDEFENLETQTVNVIKALKRHLVFSSFLKNPMKTLGF